MSKKHYDWSNGPATLEQHSVAKHKLLQGYLAAYFQTLVTPHQTELRLTIVDGFAGGGKYIHAVSNELHLGSPFICLKAAEEAEALININRTNRVAFDIDYFFFEKNKGAASFLRETINEEGYRNRVGKDVRIIDGDFNDHADSIIAHIKSKSPRNGRSIFILDQYGYRQVPMPLLAKIFQTLPRAEVILTFNVDSFSTYATDKSQTSPLEAIGLPNVFEGKSIQELKENKAQFRALIQGQLYPHIIKQAGSRFHTPFFIRTTSGHGDFWLLHLSMHSTARDVMTKVHWDNSNTFIHYGEEGLNMFKVGYITRADEQYTKQGTLGYMFDDDAKKRTREKLHEDIPNLIYADDGGLSFETLFATTCNDSPATSSDYREVVANLAKSNEVEIVLPSGKTTTAKSLIKGDARIMPPRQRKLVF